MELTEYTVYTCYKLAHTELGTTPLRSQTHKIIAEDKETAKEIAWNKILAENAYCKMVEQNARKSRRKV